MASTSSRLHRVRTALGVCAIALAATGAAQNEANQKTPGQQPTPIDVALSLERAFTAAIAKVSPSVVTVTSYVESKKPVEKNDPRAMWRVLSDANRYPGFEPLATATGFVYAKEGVILTAWHALLKPDGTPARVIDVETHDFRHVLCRVIGGEPTINVGILEFQVVPAIPPETKAAVLGDSDAVRPGQWAIALGDPFGATKTCSTGIFSALPSRQCYQGDLTATFMQASLVTHPEAYGGPVVNLRGEVVGQLMPRGTVKPGVPLAKIPGVEYVMPIKIVKNIADSMIRSSKLLDEKITRSPWFGFSVLEIAAVRAKVRGNPQKLAALKTPDTGVYIDDVFDPSPAAKAGIVVGDYLVSMNKHRLVSVLDFQQWLYLSGVGKTVTLELFRDGKTRTVDVKVELRPRNARPR